MIRLPARLAHSISPNLIERIFTLYQSMNKALGTVSTLLVGWWYRHYAGDGTSLWRAPGPISDYQLRSAAKSARNWPLLHEYLSNSQDILMNIQIKFNFLLQWIKINLECRVCWSIASNRLKNSYTLQFSKNADLTSCSKKGKSKGFQKIANMYKILFTTAVVEESFKIRVALKFFIFLWLTR